MQSRMRCLSCSARRTRRRTARDRGPAAGEASRNSGIGRGKMSRCRPSGTSRRCFVPPTFRRPGGPCSPSRLSR
eukprot:2694864-Pyramimonas_sp.AAC.2